MDNLHIWNQVRGTDPRFVSKLQHGARLDTVKGPYMVRRATEMFGPVGIGWGYHVVHHDIVDGAFMQLLQVWYVDGNGNKVLGPQEWGVCPFSKNGKVDEEAPKKAHTDSLKKCLSRLGFSADVYCGLGGKGETKIMAPLHGHHYSAERGAVAEYEMKAKTQQPQGNPPPHLEPTAREWEDLRQAEQKVRQHVTRKPGPPVGTRRIV